MMVLAVAGACLMIWAGAASAGTVKGKVVAVQAMRVERVTQRDLRIFPGTLHANAAFDVALKIGGRLQRLHVDVGDSVKKGQIVARLDDDEQIQLVHQARAELGVARAALVEARSLLVAKQRQFERSKGLFQQGIGAQVELEVDRAEAGAQQARVQVGQAQVVQRKALLRAAEVRLSYTVIRASWNGGAARRVVGERYANEGEMLAPNKPIFSVLDIASLIAVVHATEVDYAHLKPEQPVMLAADAFPGRKFPGRVARLAPQFELAELLGALKGRFILSINDTPEIRQTFAGFRTLEVKTRYSAAKQLDKRREVTELVITSELPAA